LRCLNADQRGFSCLSIRWPFPELRLELPMMDIVMMALAVGFFAVSIAYVYACEQL
jgi:hypothetical protein